MFRTNSGGGKPPDVVIVGMIEFGPFGKVMRAIASFLHHEMRL
jgi:hypothetical protein